jgi:hypothetical protein
MSVVARKARKAVDVAKTLLSLDRNTRRWTEMRGRFAGQRAFLVGNGPSLNITPLYLLDGEYTLCFNRFYLLQERLNWFPYFYMCVDPEVLDDVSLEIDEYLPSVKMGFFSAMHAGVLAGHSNVLLMHPLGKVPKFSRRLPLFASGGTVAYAGLQALFFLGFSEVYLVGVDQNYVIHTSTVATEGIKVRSLEDDDPNHFDPRYFGRGRRYHQPVQATRTSMMQAFQRAKEVAMERGVLVRNAGIGGALEVFDRVPFDSLFDLTQAQQYQRLASSIGSRCSPNKLRDILEGEEPQRIPHGAELDYFVARLDAVPGLVRSLINDYVPFGPIAERSLFIKRTALPRVQALLG